MATCILIAFGISTLWTRMPPRLLSDLDVPGDVGEKVRSYGFMDTVHGAVGESSVWTQNKFCDQYAATISLHFDYSFLIGSTISCLPLAPQHQRSRNLSLRTTFAGKTLRLRLPSIHYLACLTVGFIYHASIIVAIVATEDHFVRDAVGRTGLRTGVDWKWCIPEHAAFGGLLSVVREDRQAGKESHTLSTHVDALSHHDDGMILSLISVGRRRGAEPWWFLAAPLQLWFVQNADVFRAVMLGKLALRQSHTRRC